MKWENIKFTLGVIFGSVIANIVTRILIARGL